MLSDRQGESFLNKLADIVSDQIVTVFRKLSEENKQLSERLAQLEAREIPRGEKGDRGEKGEPGSDGFVGPVGPAGNPGERGEKGEKGDNGDRGERGPEGPEGKPGRDGRDGLNGLQGERGEKGMDGKDGRDGSDGKDGADFPKDFSHRMEGRNLILRFGEHEVSVRFDHPEYRGIYDSDQKYERGDWVAFGGSVFACMVDNPQGRPEQSSDWRLTVKRGQHGKDGKPGERGEKGSDGRPGRDLTQMTLNGEKY